MSMPANVTALDDDKRLVPMTAHVPVSQRRRVKVLAARKGMTMARLQVEIFNLGLDMMEELQADKDGN